MSIQDSKISESLSLTQCTCNVASRVTARLGPLTWKMGAWHYMSKIFSERIIFLKHVPLYSCRYVIHLHAYRHYILTLGLHARGECYWPSLMLWDETPLVGLVSSTHYFSSKVVIIHVTFLFVSVGISHRNMNHVNTCQFIYTNNEIKEDYLNPIFDFFESLSFTQWTCNVVARLGPLTTEMEAWYYKSKIFGEIIIFLKKVPLYRCRSVIHIHACHHYLPTWGLHARGECKWPSLTLWHETPIRGPCVIYPIIFRQMWYI
jgi:hypothetical protein